jgi:hypothetical protein
MVLMGFVGYFFFSIFDWCCLSFERFSFLLQILMLFVFLFLFCVMMVMDNGGNS